MTAPVAGGQNLAVARRIARSFGCTDAARELAAMLGLVDDAGFVVPDDERDIVIGFGAPKVAKPAREEHPLDFRARPKVSTAPEALRNLPPVVVEPKPVKAPAVKPRAVKQPARKPNVGVGRKLAPCGTYGAYRRHLRHREPIDAACAEAARTEWRTYVPRERYEAPHGTYTAKRRHKRNGEEPCGPCAAAKSSDPEDRARYTARRRERGIQPRELLPHGTEGAYRRHIKQKTQVCDACRASHRQRNRELEAAKRSAA